MSASFANPTTVNVRYIVNDVDACVTFYTQILGFDVMMNPPTGFAILSKGNLRLLFNQIENGNAID